MRTVTTLLLLGLAGCSQQPSTPSTKAAWYKLAEGERPIGEFVLASDQPTNLVVQSSTNVVIGFKTDVSFSRAMDYQGYSVSIRSTNTTGRVSSGMGGATRFGGAPEGIRLSVLSDFPFPVRVVVYQDDKP